MSRQERSPKEVSSRRERKKYKTENVYDPRFTQKYFDPLKHAENYQFLYDKEKEYLIKQQKSGKTSREEDRARKARIEARERLLKEKRIEKERRELEIDLVKQGKKPFYISSKQKRVIRSIETAKEKGIAHTMRVLRKKEKEKENKSRKALE